MSETCSEPISPLKERVTIYVVDDDDDVCRSLRFLLEMDGFQVCTFSSAESLLEFGGNQPDCLMVDYKMKPMDGLQLTRTLRGLGVNTPVILMTGFPDETIPHKADALGISMVMIKPHLGENLAANIRETLRLSPH
jgi:two-component system, LuxR family, response regulator FixJ